MSEEQGLSPSKAASRPKEASSGLALYWPSTATPQQKSLAFRPEEQGYQPARAPAVTPPMGRVPLPLRIACRHGGAVLSPCGAPSRKEGSTMQHFLRDVLATCAGTVLAAYLIRILGL